jgi:hypothetical protein
MHPPHDSPPPLTTTHDNMAALRDYATPKNLVDELRANPFANPQHLRITEESPTKVIRVIPQPDGGTLTYEWGRSQHDVNQSSTAPTKIWDVAKRAASLLFAKLVWWTGFGTLSTVVIFCLGLSLLY